MKALAEIVFDHLWLLLFEGEEIIDLDYSVKMQESLPEYFSAMSQEEKDALSDVARDIQAKLLAEPDEQGYTPRSLITDEQKEFMEALATGELFEEWA
ncbi:hypothetical protein [Alcanivorax sp.]|uniref:hypothetical protein n=1 Tax=Alcanivorax sp. TaxID=1872427 RepID=UPI002B26CE08|nr:hypothetical protein [Alcanivorax sp.]